MSRAFLITKLNKSVYDLDHDQSSDLRHRLLLDSGLAADWDMEYNSFFGGEGRAPPASKKAVADLETKLICPSVAGQSETFFFI